MKTPLSNLAEFALKTCAMLVVSAPLWAQTAPAPNAVVAIVNGQPVTQASVNAAVASFQAQGANDSPQLRDQVVIELIAREALVSEGARLGLDKSPAFQQRMEEARRGLLMDAAWADHMQKNPVTEQEERADYERQKAALGGGDTIPQYLISHIVLADEAQAIGALVRARKGEAFDKLAASLSIDPGTRAKGGQIGWVLPGEVMPAIGNVLVNLAKGTVAAAPIQTPAGWQVIRVDDVRPFKIPGFEESRPQLKAAVQNVRRQKFMEDLIKKADIKRP